MIDLNRLFENWFQNPEITPARKLSFADDLRDRLAANNAGGVFNVILPQLDAALTAAGGAASSEAVAIAVRKAGVQAKVTLLEEIKTLISRRSGRISDGFGKKSAVYTEFFPNGVTAYREMIEGGVDAHLDILIAAGKKHDPAMEAEFKALKASWAAAKQAAGDQIATASAAGGGQDAAIATLNEVLMKVVFTAALAFAGDTKMGPLLFDQSRLYPAGSSGSAVPAPLPVA